MKLENGALLKDLLDMTDCKNWTSFYKKVSDERSTPSILPLASEKGGHISVMRSHASLMKPPSL